MRRPPAPAVAAVALLAVAAAATVAVAVSSGDDDPRAGTTTTTPNQAAGRNGGATTTVPGGSASGSTADPGNGSTSDTTPSVNVPSTSDGIFRVVGSTIVDPSGNVFVPMGANVAVRQGRFEEGYAFNWNGTATGHVDDAVAWGWNTVRATLVCIPQADGPTAEEITAGLDAFIEEYTAKRVVVIVECHDVTGDDPTARSPRVDQLLAFWERVATRWKDDPYVWFNMFNEPQTTTDAAGVANWMELQTAALDRLRAIAPTAMFVADLPGHAQGLETLTGPAPATQLGSGRCNVVYGWHAYGAVGKDGTFGREADYDNEAASRENHRQVFEFARDRQIPLLIGELGDPLTLDEGTAGQPIWNRIGAFAVMDLAPQYGVGLVWWHGTGDSGVFLTYSLMADRHQAPWAAATNGDGLSAGGRRFWEVSRAAAARPATPFTGDLAAANCG